MRASARLREAGEVAVARPFAAPRARPADRPAEPCRRRPPPGPRRGGTKREAPPEPRPPATRLSEPSEARPAAGGPAAERTAKRSGDACKAARGAELSTTLAEIVNASEARTTAAAALRARAGALPGRHPGGQGTPSPTRGEGAAELRDGSACFTKRAARTAAPEAPAKLAPKPRSEAERAGSPKGGRGASWSPLRAGEPSRQAGGLGGGGRVGEPPA